MEKTPDTILETIRRAKLIAILERIQGIEFTAPEAAELIEAIQARTRL